MKEKPLAINSFLEGEHVRGYYVEAVDKPGVLWSILDVFRKHEVNVLSINFSPTSKSERVGLLFIVADLKGAEGLEEKILKELRDTQDVLNVELEKPQYFGILADHLHFPLVDGNGRRCLLTSEKEYEYTLKLIRERLGSPGLALLYHEGRAIGSGYAKLFAELGIENLKDLITLFLIYIRGYGILKGELVECSFDQSARKGKIIVRAYRLWECEAAKKAGINEPSSHKTRGVLAGLIEDYVKARVHVREVKCIAKGDPYCEFLAEIG
ncbi:MAG: hypothetical protein DRN06_01285 [Thermoprotei archaeon]|nr:MAG: hypothetical protein DRN06_01285 [Thermoprotei archaeon]